MKRQSLAAITGLGVTPLTRSYTASSRELAAWAIQLALDDARLNLADVDGLVVIRSPVAAPEELGLDLQTVLGLGDLRFSLIPEMEGASFVIGMQLASLAIQAGIVRNVVCVFADTPLRTRGASSASAYSESLNLSLIPGWEQRHALLGAIAPFALLARRYMSLYSKQEHYLGYVALADRKWASLNPGAMLRQPLTIEDYCNTSPIVDPMRRFDCAFPVNGAAAVLISNVQVAESSPQKPVYIHGLGQGHNKELLYDSQFDALQTAAGMAAEGAYNMAGITPSEVSLRQFYEAFSVAQWLSLESYGFCDRGEAADLVASGATGPGGSLPTNTDGGHLSGSYLQGATPVVEAIIQARGLGGDRQVTSDIILVTGFGGFMSHHACLILSPLRSLD